MSANHGSFGSHEPKPRIKRDFKYNWSWQSDLSEVGDAVRSALDQASEVFSALFAKQLLTPEEKARTEQYRRLVRKADQTERSAESNRKGSIFFAVGALIFFVSAIFEWESGLLVPASIFGGLSFISYTTFREKVKKLDTVRAEIAMLASRVDVPMPVRNAPSAAAISLEKVILQQAKQSKGRVYVEHVALETSGSIDQIESGLKSLVEKKIASVEFDNNGRVYYYFPSFDTEASA